MLCSARELGLGDDHAGILSLDGALRPARPCARPSASSPTCSTTSRSTPTAPTPCRWPAWPATSLPAWACPSRLPSPRRSPARASPPRPWPPSSSSTPTCAVGSRPACCATSRSGQSPQWIANRLTQLGMRPINALVDISNYVMLELGQPNHPYDLAAGRRRRLPGAPGARRRDAHHPRRRRAPRHGRRPPHLRRPTTRPSASPGVMGGASCEIAARTTDVLLEMAWFQPMADQPHLAPPRPALRGVGPLRQGLRPRGHRPRGRPLLPARGRDLRGHHRTRRGRRAGRAARPVAGAGAHRPGQRHPRHRPRRLPPSPATSSRSASPPRPSATTTTW